MPPKLDDAPWKYEDPDERARRHARDRLRVQLFGGGAEQFWRCDQCGALTLEQDSGIHKNWHRAMGAGTGLIGDAT